MAFWRRDMATDDVLRPMNARLRILIALVAVVSVLVGVLLLNRAGKESDAQDPDLGIDNAALACYDVRQAATYLDGTYTPLGMVVGVLDLAFQASHAAVQQSSRWTELDTAVTEFHAAGHAGDPARLQEGKTRSLAACEAVPDPDLP
jgi:hypothetical protein